MGEDETAMFAGHLTPYFNQHNNKDEFDSQSFGGGIIAANSLPFWRESDRLTARFAISCNTGDSTNHGYFAEVFGTGIGVPNLSPPGGMRAQKRTAGDIERIGNKGRTLRVRNQISPGSGPGR